MNAFSPAKGQKIRHADENQRTTEFEELMKIETDFQEDEPNRFSRKTIPPSVQRYDQWVTWGNMKTEKKCPTQPVANSQAASSTDPTTWGTLDEALAHVNLNEDRGLGFVLTEDDPYLAFDVDCPDYSDGSLPDWLPPLGDLGCESWVYLTPSGAGWRVVIKTPSGEDAIPDWWTNLSDEYDGQTREVQLIQARKYVTVTDDVLEEHRIPGEVKPADLDKWLQELHTRFTGDSPPRGHPLPR